MNTETRRHNAQAVILTDGYDDETMKGLIRGVSTPTLATERKVGSAPVERFFWAWNPSAWRWFHVAEADLTSCGYTFARHSSNV
jgi:hypothetical protein